jgi:hypothetical protein
VIRKGGGDMSLESGLRICETTPRQDTDMHKPATSLGSSRCKNENFLSYKATTKCCEDTFLQITSEWDSVI